MRDTLTIYTNYPATVADLLVNDAELVKQEDLVGQGATYLQIKHSWDEGMELSLKIWLAVAQSIGLVTEPSFNKQSGGKP